MKNTLFLLFTLVSVQAFGCRCIPAPLLYYHQRSDFVALVKILKSTLDPKDDIYLTVEIETISQYKGTPTTSLLVNTSAHTSCAFLIPKNSTWLVFARKGEKGVLGFGACSGSEQTDRMSNSVQYPNAATNHKRSIDLKLTVLSFLRNNELEDSNPYHLDLPKIRFHVDTTFRNFENRNRFAVYQVAVNEDLSIEGITTLQAFDNPKLDLLLSERIRKDARVYTNRKRIPTKTKFVVIYYYYPAEGNDPSFVSDFDV